MIKKIARGDTIIEVLMAVTLFSMVAVGSIALMNKGVAMAQQSLETTLVRQQIDGQAEMLRFVHDKARNGEQPYAGIWGKINATINTATPVEENLDVDQCKDSFSKNGFVLYSSRIDESSGAIQFNNALYGPADVFAKIEDGGRSQGIDIQLTKVQNGKAYDAYIQACWDTPASEKPMTIGTIVRLYDPEA